MSVQSSLSAFAWVISPINVLQCMIAHKYFQEYLGRKINLTILHHYPTDDNALSQEIYGVVCDLTKSINPDVACHSVSYENGTSAKQVEPYLHGFAPDYLFYAHDVVGDLLDTLRQISPKAETICYGDALGQFFNKEIHLGYLAPASPLKNLYKYAVSILSEGFRFSEKGSTGADYAVLSIPVSQSKLPRNTKLLVPSRHTVCDVIFACINNNMVVKKVCDALLAEIEADLSRPVYLMPIENMSEGNFLPINKEVELYLESIRTYCPSGSLVFIKPHPGERVDKTELMQQSIGNEYILRKIDHSYKRYPIELFLPLLKRCKVLCMFYPVLSLKYLYGMDVVQPLNNQMIEKYFDRSFWRSYKNAIQLNMIPLARLENWDGKSLLYNGK
jgi:hypothetical protein